MSTRGSGGKEVGGGASAASATDPSPMVVTVDQKKYSYRPPRIDAEAFQAVIPDIIIPGAKPSKSTVSW